MLLPVTQHSGLIFLYIAKWLPDMSSYHLSPHRDITQLLPILPTLYISNPWLIYFATGSLYLSTPLTYSSASPTLSPLATICLSSVSLTLLLFSFKNSLLLTHSRHPADIFWVHPRQSPSVRQDLCPVSGFFMPSPAPKRYFHVNKVFSPTNTVTGCSKSPNQVSLASLGPTRMPETNDRSQTNGRCWLALGIMWCLWFTDRNPRSG